jgi:hypothetical protein
METPRIKALRQAQLCGHLIDRTDRLYYPGGSHPLCSVQTAQEMVRAGWLVRRDGRYEITPAGLRVLELELSNMSDSSSGDERAMNILRELHAAEKELVGRAVVLTDGKAGTIDQLFLDDEHGLRVAIRGHEGRWPISTVKHIES